MLISKNTAVAALLLCSAGPYSACTAAIGWLCRTGLICVCCFDLLTECVNKFVYAHGSCSCSWGKACKKEELVFTLPSVLRNWHCAAFTAVCICITISCCYRDSLWVGLYHFLLWKGNKNWLFLIAPLWKVHAATSLSATYVWNATNMTTSWAKQSWAEHKFI